MFNKSQNQREAGFSLLELLGVLAIVGIVSVVALAGLQPRSKSLELKTTSSAIASTLRRARSRAITRNREITVSFDFNTRRYWQSNASKYGTMPAGMKGTLVTASGEVLSGNSGRVRFFPNGSSTGGMLKLQLQNHKKIISIDWMSGSVRIEDPKPEI